jgi:AraC-like DNA-binding protein
VLDLIDEESAADRPGRDLVLARLLEVMLVEAIRHDAAGVAEAGQGLVAGLRDPQIAQALRALHADIRRPWTVAALAEVAGVSRSVFAERFARVVGAPPIDYLLHWRMALAKDGLRAGRRLAEVAFAIGYTSASAFSTAFSRTVGCPPGRYAGASGQGPVESRPA